MPCCACCYLNKIFVSLHPPHIQERMSMYCSGCFGSHSVGQAVRNLRPPAFASRVLRLEVCATVAWFSSHCLSLVFNKNNCLFFYLILCFNSSSTSFLFSHTAHLPSHPTSILLLKESKLSPGKSNKSLTHQLGLQKVISCITGPTASSLIICPNHAIVTQLYSGHLVPQLSVWNQWSLTISGWAMWFLVVTSPIRVSYVISFFFKCFGLTLKVCSSFNPLNMFGKAPYAFNFFQKLHKISIFLSLIFFFQGLKYHCGGFTALVWKSHNIFKSLPWGLNFSEFSCHLYL